MIHSNNFFESCKNERELYVQARYFVWVENPPGLIESIEQ